LIPSTASDCPSLPPPSRLQLLGRIAGHAWQQARTAGPADGLRVLLGAGRMLGERDELARLFTIPAFTRLMAAPSRADAFFFISHRHFLSRGFSGAERLACVLDHFLFEQAHFAPNLLPALHGDGLRLWRHLAGYEIRLRANVQTRHEGPLSLVLRHRGETLHEISFVWIEAGRLGPAAGRGPVLFATRNQCMLPADSPTLASFRADFPQNSPPYFMFAALTGLTQAVGQTRVVGVRDHRQIAFEPRYADGFRRAYDDFWLSFGGQPSSPHGWEMPVPAVVTPLDQLKAKHRARARQRRQHWRQIADDVQASLSPYLRA
jgi:hypothetical protein